MLSPFFSFVFAAVADISTAADYDCMKEGEWIERRDGMGWYGIGQFSMGWHKLEQA